ncbi:MAG: hypothetical protein AB7E37_01675 [Candidatus Altimarinota bacterium]
MKKNILLFLGVYASFMAKLFASGPEVVCNGLPGCKSDTVGQVNNSVTSESFFAFVGNLISTTIQYIAVLSVLALVVAGIMYLVSAGEEEKVKKAKSAIIWSLVGVLVSTTAWAIINLLNSFRIN